MKPDVSVLEDEELIETLPKMPPAAASFEEIVDLAMYDLWTNTKAERDAGATHSHHVLHVPGKTGATMPLQQLCELPWHVCI